MSQQTGKSPNRLISRIENIGQRVGQGLRSRFKQNAQKNNRLSATGSLYSSTSGRLPTSTTNFSVVSQGSGATSSLQVPSSIQITGSSTSISSGHSSSSVPTTAGHTINVKPSQPPLVAPPSNSTAVSPSIALLNPSQTIAIFQSPSSGPSAPLLPQPVLLQPVNINAAIAEIRKAEEIIKQKRSKWRYTNRHGKEVDVVERIGKFLRSLDQCAKIVDIGIQHNPEITSLVWAGLRFILMVAFNTIQYIEEMEAAMATMVEKIAICEFYAHIYEGVKLKSRSAETAQALEEHLDSVLKELYKAVQAFLDEAKQYYDPLAPAIKKVKYSLMPFSVFMGPFIDKISQQEKEVEACAQMATMERIVEGSESLKEMKAIVDEIKNEMGSLTKLDEIIQLSTNQLQMMTGIQVAVSDIKSKLAMVKTLEPLQVQLLSLTPLDTDLQQLRKDFLAESERSDIYEVDLYVPTQGMPHPHSSESEYFDLTQRIDEFLADSNFQRVCLIQGAAGSGKSTFTHHLARTLWSRYYKSSPTEQATVAIPLFMSLTSVHDPASRNEDLIEKFFQQPPHKWTKEKIEVARDKLSFVFILDGYDEIERRDRNFFIDNKLGHWKAKVVLTSRPEYLEQGYQSKFYPSRGQQRLLQEYWMAPFSPKSIGQYISSYVKVEIARTGSSLSVEHYKQLLSPPEVQALISNPFLLRMVMTVQSALDRSQVQGKLEVKRVFLYRQFLNHWYSQAQSRLDVIQLPEAQREAFSALCYDDDLGFQNHVQLFCQRFALALYERQMIEATYELPSDDYEYDSNPQPQQSSPWKHFLTNSDQKIRLLRYSSPLARNQRSYRFIHKSLRDFIVAQSLWNDRSLGTTQARINQFHLVDDPGVLDFVVEQVESAPILQDKLLAYVEQSKKDPLVQQAATNAITILVRSGKRFGGYDLRGIRVPGADVSYGWFERARLQNSDLRQTRMQGIWLREADMTGAQMDGVWFGEKPFFELPDKSRVRACFHSSGGELLVGACAYANFGRTVAAGNHTKTIEVWSLRTQKRIHFLDIENDDENDEGNDFLSFSSDVLYCASRYENEVIKLWDIVNKKLVCTFEGHQCKVMAAIFSPDNEVLLSIDDYGTGRLWSIAEKRQLHVLDKLGGRIRSVAFMPDETREQSDENVFAAGYNTGVIRLWSVSNQVLHTFTGHNDQLIHCVTFSPDGQMLAAGGTAGLISLWSVSHKKLIHNFWDHSKPVFEVRFSPDGHTLASASQDGTMRLWSVQNHCLLHVYQIDVGNPHIVLFSLSGQHVVTACDGASIVLQLQVPRAQQATYTDNHSDSPDSLRSVTLSPDGQFLASGGGRNGEMHLWSVSECRIVHIYKDHLSEVNSVVFSPNGKLLASGSSDHTVRLWSVPDRRLIHTYEGHLKWVQSVAFSQSGKFIVSGSDDGTVCLWSVEERQIVHTFIHPPEPRTPGVEAVAISPNGELIASGYDDRMMRLWSISERQMIHTHSNKDAIRWFKGDHTGNILGVAFSPDGKLLAMSSDDKTVRLWSVSENKIVHTFRDHRGKVNHVAFSPDGDMLASSGYDSVLIIRSVQSKEILIRLDIDESTFTFAWGPAMKTGANIDAELGIHSQIAIGTRKAITQLWQVRKKANYTAENLAIDLICQWSTNQGKKLCIGEMNIHGVKGLGPGNCELLRQYGACGRIAEELGDLPTSALAELGISTGEKL